MKCCAAGRGGGWPWQLECRWCRQARRSLAMEGELRWCRWVRRRLAGDVEGEHRAPTDPGSTGIAMALRGCWRRKLDSGFDN
jgi:hypothetical protein